MLHKPGAFQKVLDALLRLHTTVVGENDIDDAVPTYSIMEIEDLMLTEVKLLQTDFEQYLDVLAILSDANDSADVLEVPNTEIILRGKEKGHVFS